MTAVKYLIKLTIFILLNDSHLQDRHPPCLALDNGKPYPFAATKSTPVIDGEMNTTKTIFCEPIQARKADRTNAEARQYLRGHVRQAFRDNRFQANIDDEGSRPQEEVV